MVHYQDLCAALKGDSGLSLLSSVNCLDFARDATRILASLLSSKVV